MRLLVIGGSGLVGTNISDRGSERGVDVVGTYRSNETADTSIRLDKTDASAVHDVVRDVDPDAVVDTAAFHSVDACETDRERAWAVNARGTRNAAVAANDAGAQFVYLSTDYVFSGDPEAAPFAASDPVSPVNYYAQSKYCGEQAAKLADRATVLRTSVVYGLDRPNFVTWLLDELRAGNAVDIVDDQISTPTYAPDLAEACVEAVERDLTGVYHAAGPASMSRYEFSTVLADTFDLDESLVRPTTTAEFGQEAPRPEDGSLDSARLCDAVDARLRGPADAFAAMRERR
jgi:dTDP-4-dehydrorhamnose reductase